MILFYNCRVMIDAYLFDECYVGGNTVIQFITSMHASESSIEWNIMLFKVNKRQIIAQGKSPGFSLFMSGIGIVPN